MANINNLKPFNTMTKERQREIARQGGIASGKARLRKKLLRVYLRLSYDEMKEQEEQEEKQPMRKAFKKDNLREFESLAVEYLELDQERKTVNDFCDYIGITRYTLSKYRQRGSDWQEIIDEIKNSIRAYNFEMKAAVEYKKLIKYAEKYKG